ncbi:MAG: VOC family protein [Rhodospirillaceae bacterium]
MSQTVLTSPACMTYACSDPKKMTTLLSDVFGWKTLCDGAIDADLEALWGIAPSSAGGSFAVLCSPGSDRGMMRIVAGEDRKRNAPMSTRWSGVEIVVMEDIEGLHEKLESHPDFTIGRLPKTIDFTDAGANIHTYFYVYPPGGTHFMMTMARTECRDYVFPYSPNPVGHIFDVHLDIDKDGPSRRFYEEILGLTAVFDEDITEGLFYETWDIPADSPANLTLLKGDAPKFGLDGIEMRIFEKRVMDPLPPVADKFDPGCCMTTYSCTDIEAVYRAVSASSNATILSELRPVSGEPYAGATAFAFLGPEGERVEICDKMWG